MVTKAYVKGVTSKGEVKVLIPAITGYEELEGEKELEDMQTGWVCTTPGCVPKYKANDVVYICIEDNNLSNPVIMGTLDTGKTPTIQTDAFFSSLTVETNAKLPKDTSIGKDVTSSNLQNLKGLSFNVQNEFVALNSVVQEALNYTTTKLNAFLK